ncbi:DUF5685 family protein [Peptostreptococcus equinus]|uniref:DUF5685 family protein n=1 Tax=Peptostreptococcus equinus TaxID=3003601 RepID=A0ABY7JMA8_9FIRM|nr:DUF5685 family protein [Peptostreptococcus sp. CBA3647]WAW14484.1 DUF5685 family protein [Peptostreptococcus sp. CBA3647]
MFGYVRINKMDLTFREYYHYKAYYCGLCKYLKRNHTEISRLSLNYDITFLILILTSVYEPKSDIFNEKCIVNPTKKKMHISNKYTEYAASMNILLTYYKLEDNVIDEGRLKDKFLKSAYEKSYKTALAEYPEKAQKIKNHMKKLNNLELENCQNIDEISNVFGELMSDIFSYKEDEYMDRLSRVGFNIGKYIYILDAYEDLDKDLEKGSYNPFKKYENDREKLRENVDKNIGFTLTMLEEAINSLDIKINKSIIDNILYSGIYLRYKGILLGKINEKNMK